MTACDYLRVVEHDDALGEATHVLYATPPDDFLAKRSELAAAAKAAGAAETARAIARLRKPTVAAWIVNAYALAEPDVVAQLTAVGDELRRAQDTLDVDQLRTLSAGRRSLVAGLTDGALRHSARRGASTSLRDEVSATFDAAVADPAVAAALGSLQHAEQFSGFGFGAAPQLTLVPGGKRAAPTARSDAPAGARAAAKAGAKAAAPAAKPQRSAAEQRRLAGALRSASDAMGAAERRLADALDSERTGKAQVQALEQQLAQIRRELDETRRASEHAKQQVVAARADRATAADALKDAERAAAR